MGKRIHMSRIQRFISETSILNGYEGVFSHKDKIRCRILKLKLDFIDFRKI